jgi:hypothetical protein
VGHRARPRWQFTNTTESFGWAGRSHSILVQNQAVVETPIGGRLAWVSGAERRDRVVAHVAEPTKSGLPPALLPWQKLRLLIAAASAWSGRMPVGHRVLAGADAVATTSASITLRPCSTDSALEGGGSRSMGSTTLAGR